MGKTRYLPPAGKNFHLARLLQAMSTGADSYEAGICELQLQRNVETDRQSGAVFLPDATLTRDLGIGTAADGGDLAALLLLQHVRSWCSIASAAGDWK
jgi:hypothetical protein